MHLVIKILKFFWRWLINDNPLHATDASSSREVCRNSRRSVIELPKDTLTVWLMLNSIELKECDPTFVDGDGVKRFVESWREVVDREEDRVSRGEKFDRIGCFSLRKYAHNIHYGPQAFMELFCS